jgi:hypothetical protein
MAKEPFLPPIQPRILMAMPAIFSEQPVNSKHLDLGAK